MANRLKSAPAPTQPPKADMSVLVQRVDELSQKVLNKALGSGAKDGLPRWKRWVEGAGEFDVSGLRDRLATLTVFANQMKFEDIDPMKQEILDLKIDVAALKEAPPARPFP